MPRGKQKPTKIWTVDTESRGLGGQITLAGFYTRFDDGTDKFVRCYNIDDMYERICEEVLKDPEHYHVFYAHHLDYDARYFLINRTQYIDTMRTMFIDNVITVLKFTKKMMDGCQNFEFRDSYKIFMAGLDDCCRDWNIEHKKMHPSSQFEKYKIECNKCSRTCAPYTQCNEKDKEKECEWIDHCRDQYFMSVDPHDKWFQEYHKIDCVSLYELIQALRAELENVAGKPVEPGYTAASTALRLYRAMEPDYFDDIVWQKRAEEERGCLKMVRDAYAGGRCEVFKRYGRNLHSYDVTSLYPSVMYFNPMPTEPMAPQDISVSDFLRKHKDYDYIVHAVVETPKDLMVPLLAVRAQVPGSKETKFLFPLGTLEGYWASPEFKHALELGYKVKEIKKVIWYTRYANFFKTYVDKLFKMKSENKGNSKGAMAKLMMNSLYGKFGQRDEVHRIKICDAEEFTRFTQERDEDGEPINIIRQTRSLPDDKFLIEYVSTAYMRHNYVSIACFITSYARMVLYEGIEEVHEAGGECYYVDTDSMKTDVEIPSGNKLGQFKHEYDVYEGVFIRPKVYACWKKPKPGEPAPKKPVIEIKNKGVLQKALKGFSMNTIKKWLFMPQVTLYDMEYHPGSPTPYMRIPKTRDVMLELKEITEKAPMKKTQSLIDDKRVITPNKIDTFPIGYEGPWVDQLGKPLKGADGPMEERVFTRGRLKQLEKKRKQLEKLKPQDMELTIDEERVLNDTDIK